MKKGWEIKRLGEIVDTINGLWTGKKEPYISVKVYTMSNFTKDCEINYSKEPREVQASISQYEKRKLKKGDLLLEKSGGGPNQPVGRVIHFNIENNENNTFSNFTTRLRVNEESKELVCSDYVHKFLKLVYITGGTDIFQKNSTNIRNLKLKEYLELQIPLPSLPEQQRIVKILDKAFVAIDKTKQNAEYNLRNAKELFESYLQRVFENKGDWAEKQIKHLTTLVTKGSSPNWQGVNYVEDGGIFFLTSKNVGQGELFLNNKKYLEEKFNEIQKTSILKKGDVLTNIVGASIGRTAIFDLNEITNINQAVCLMRCLPYKIYNYYLGS